MCFVWWNNWSGLGVLISVSIFDSFVIGVG